jgi:hypothetical protein
MSNTEFVMVPREWLNRVALLHMPLDELQEQAVELLCEPCDEPAEQHQGEPVADAEQWWADTPDGDSALVMRVSDCADPGEVERLRAALKFYADREHYHFESGNWDTVSGEPLNILWCGDEPDFIEDGTVARNALSASAEPSAPVERDENADFEKWARSRITPLNLELDEIGLYHDLAAGTAHDAWQARAALERKP